ncbi:MAG: acyl-CoA dehydrogenase family protein, partial [Desulfobacteraceae bacterium]|nr:acyl-CoA dehydrogenase family protein [Desulfobacteraceae bacterium]
MPDNNKELKLIEKSASEFARKILTPEREENDRYPFVDFFYPVIEKAFDLDFFHIFLPELFGGIGHGITAFCTLLDNICQKDSSLGGIL